MAGNILIERQRAHIHPCFWNYKRGFPVSQSNFVTEFSSTIRGDIVGKRRRRMRIKLRDVKGSIVAKKRANIEGHNHEKQSSHYYLPRFGIEGRTQCKTPHCCCPFSFSFFFFFTLSVGFPSNACENGKR
ncbi:hypothetical protein V8G54_029935 [Vigna mungo]|uniref:Uncharacterized protein n=1 Tax=Vigna mungo TaxID=3915 RepID=A0AAQ3MW49_VIGMU